MKSFISAVATRLMGGSAGGPSLAMDSTVLEKVSAKVQIVNFAARVVLEQTYVNKSKTKINASYVFPLESDAAICGFEARIGGKVVRGKVQGRGEAKQTYNAAVENSQAAMLLEKKSGTNNDFECQVGSLLPGEKCVVRVTYVTELESEGPATRFLLPKSSLSTLLTPNKYSVRQDILSRRAAKTGVAEGGFTLTVDIQMPSSITKIATPKLSMKTAYSSEKRRILKLTSGGNIEGQVVILVEQENPFTARGIVENFDSSGAAFRVPDLKAVKEQGGEAPTDAKAAGGAAVSSRVVQLTVNREYVDPDTDMCCEMVFLVDKSGSMRHENRMESTKETLEILMNSLPTNCRFNVVSFASRFSAMSRDSVPYSDTTMQQARDFISFLQPRGGTNIFDPLKSVLSKAPIKGYPRQVFLLTDGEVRNPDSVIRLAGQYASTARIFTFGIGAGADVRLCKEISRKSGGACEMIHDSANIADQVMRVIMSALQPPLCGTDVDWAGMSKAQQVPALPPPFYPGRQFIYAVGVDTAKTGSSTFTLASTINQDEEKTQIPVNFDAARSGTLLHVLAARARIRELENAVAETLSAAAKSEIRSLGIKYNLASSETSFVAVLEQDDDEQKDARGAAGRPKTVMLAVAPGQGQLAPLTGGSKWNRSLSPASGARNFRGKKKKGGVRSRGVRSVAKGFTTLNSVRPARRKLAAPRSFGFQRGSAPSGPPGAPAPSGAPEPSGAPAPRGIFPMPPPAPSGAPAPRGIFPMPPGGGGMGGAPRKMDALSKMKNCRKSSDNDDEEEEDFGETKQETTNVYARILSLQNANGSWKADAELFKIAVDAGFVGMAQAIAIAKDLAKANGAELDSSSAAAVTATLVAIAVLHKRFEQKKVSFMLLEMKANKFVASQTGGIKDKNKIKAIFQEFAKRAGQP